MSKIPLFSVLLVSTALFISCSPLRHHPSMPSETPDTIPLEIKTNASGAYLAGRIAHLRKDFDNAADYYKIALNQDPDNIELTDRLYLLLTSKGRIDEAAHYAQKAINLKSPNGFARMLVSTQQMQKKQYAASRDTIKTINDPIYKGLIIPLFNAWNEAGLSHSTEALAALKPLSSEESLVPIYRLHRAMLLDYLGQNREAAEAYAKILADKDAEISVRTLELITNFYVRTGQKDKAVAMLNSTVNNQALDSLLASLRLQINMADEKATQPILSSPQIGAAEALFTIASTFRYDEAIDIAHMYTALAIYLNPAYSTAKVLMADIFEARGMYEDANHIYDSINKNDIAYYAAQLKKARNLVKQEDYKGAEILLESLSDDYKDMQIYMELGDILRLNNRFTEAVEYYDRAINKTKNPVNLWVLYYAKGVSLERAGLWKEAEAVLLKAYDLQKHYLVLNHLGYTWIKQNQNIEKAFAMIVEAYNQASFDPSINDSLGFALYSLGYYTMALPYLEKAAELYPSSAVICSHLGDAYWFAHRKNEARFQWQHALRLKDDSGELDIKATKAKIKNGIIQEPKLTYDKEAIAKTLQKISPSKLAQK